MYVRFVPDIDDPASEYVWSVFGAMGHLFEKGGLSDYEDQRLRELDQWFEANLKEPTRLSYFIQTEITRNPLKSPS